MLTPITSNEMYLAKLCGMDVDVPNPITRMEMYLAKLCGMKIDIPTPIARVDLYLAKLCGMNVVVPEPITRLEQYMAKLCGMNVVVPEPITREEYYWRIYSDFREYTGALPIVIASRSGGTLRNYRIYGNSVQDGVPTPEEPIEVQSVGDKTVNLLNNSPDYWEQGQIIYGGSRVSVTTRIRTVSKFQILPNTTYTLQAWGNIVPAFHLWQANGTYINDSTWITTLPHTFTTPSTAAWIEFTCRRTNNTDSIEPSCMNESCFLQLENDATATEYEPYGYKIPIAVYGTNNNLFNDTDLSYGAWYDGTGAYLTDTTYSVMSDYLPVSSAQYYVQILGTPPFSFELVWFDNNKDFISRYYRTSLSSQEYICKAADGSAFFRIGLACRTSQTITEDYVLDSNLYVSTVPIDKTTTNIYLNEPLRKIGDYADYVDFQNRCVVRNVKKMVLTGNESDWLKNTSILQTDAFTNKALYADYVRADGYMSHYPTAHVSYGTADYASFGISINICNKLSHGYDTVDKFKAYLAEQYTNGTPVTVYYALATPTADLIEPPEIPTFEGENVLTVDTTIQPSQMYVKYL